jgi:hypothetical protein
MASAFEHQRADITRLSVQSGINRTPGGMRCWQSVNSNQLVAGADAFDRWPAVLGGDCFDDVIAASDSGNRW